VNGTPISSDANGSDGNGSASRRIRRGMSDRPGRILPVAGFERRRVATSERQRADFKLKHVGFFLRFLTSFFEKSLTRKRDHVSDEKLALGLDGGPVVEGSRLCRPAANGIKLSTAVSYDFS